MKTLAQVFAEGLAIELAEVNEALLYQGIPQWNSVAHMRLVALMEETYNILLDTDDIIAMSSFAKARSTLEQYGVSGL